MVLRILIIVMCVSMTKPDDCVLQRVNYSVYDMFHLNGVPVKTVDGRFQITSLNDSDGCNLSLKTIVDLINIPEHVVVRFIFDCKRLITIHINDSETTMLSNVISYLQVEHCVIDIDDVDKIGHMSDLKVITIYHSDLTDRQGNQRCRGLRNAVSFWIEVDPDSGKRPDVEEILDCAERFPQTVEVGFRNMSWQIFPVYLQEKFPYLQTLDLTHNLLTIPPDFPWTDDVEILPSNLSRSPYFQDHYTASFHIHIPAHIFRRILFLDNNNITDLTNHTFVGLLHMLSIKSNGLKWIGPQTFSSLRAIQTLLLSDNMLTTIPRTSFQNLDSLKHLDMRHNKINNLKITTFEGLFSLKYLNLANNKIKKIQPGVFSQLRNLKELHLEWNAIHTVSRNCLPADSIELNFVYLNNNPITVLPDVFLLLRKLKRVDFSSTNISLSNLNAFLENIPFQQFTRSVQKSASESAIDLERTPEQIREINLANSHIHRLVLEDNTTTEQSQKLALLLKHFRLILDNNPIVCDCNIIKFNAFVESLLTNRSVRENDNVFASWKCAMPAEFHGRAMLDVKPEETYCRVNVLYCPRVCECSRRHGSGIIIVDCRERGLVKLPNRLPKGLLDLWFQRNNITNIKTRGFTSRTRHLYLSNNLVSHIDDGFFASSNALEELRLDRNRLTHLSKDIENLRRTIIHIEHNPFRCDCKTLWMKRWMSHNAFLIRNMTEIICNTGKQDEEGRQFTLVPNNEFVCKQDFDVWYAVIPSVAFLLVVLLVLIRFYRTEIKVLLYVHLGIHPFDKDTSDNDVVDALVVHSPDLTDWTLQNIVYPLENCHNRLTVCDIMRDFIAGLSFQDNISRLVSHSRRLVLCISQSMKAENGIFKISSNAARETIKESKTNFAIIVSYDVPLKGIKEREISKFIRPCRFLNKDEKLFKQKLIYSMPCDSRRNDVHAVNVRNSLQTRCFLDFFVDMIPTNQNTQFDIFISYADRDIPFLLHHLQPDLEAKGYRLCIPDRNFMPGAAKEENILNAIEKSRWTLFILSGSHLQDEWSLFVFRSARGKSLRDKSNHLVVIVMDETETMDAEVGHYLKTHVSIQSDDTWFWHRLFASMPLKGVTHVNSHRETNSVDSNMFC